MSLSAAAHSRGSSLSGGPSMLGMIRARKMAMKIKKRAKFLVAERRRLDNKGIAAIVHRDFPKSQFRQGDSNLLNVGLSLAPSSRPPSALSSKVGSSIVQRLPSNTYRLEPTSRFSERRVKEIIEAVLEENLAGKTYDALLGKEMSKHISEVIKQKVKHCAFSRYKYICIAYVGQSKNQDMRIGSRCLWNKKFDNVAEGNFRNGDLFAVATVYGVYCE